MPALLEVADLSVEFRGDRGIRKVLEGIGFEVHDGETVGIVGESGSGKSVLLATIMGLLQSPWRVTAGHVRLQGRELLGLRERELSAIRGKELGLAFANPRQHLNPILPIGRQISNVVRAHGPQRPEQALARAAELLGSVGIPDPVSRLQAYPHELSGGMCQRVILALAIAHAPRLLMVDEPTSGLDVTISAQILDLLRDAVHRLRSGMIVVSRDLAIVAHYCERVLVMRGGQVIEDAPVQGFFAAPREAYSRQLLRAAAASRDPDLAAEAATATNPAAAIVDPVLEIVGLTKHFPVKGGKLLTAVQNVSLTIGRGEAVALVGESGSGKTTVGRCILRLIEPTDGTVRFKGQDVTVLPTAQFQKYRSRIQMVFQDPFDSMDPRQRVGDAILEPIRLTKSMGAGERQARAEQLLDLVGLDRASTRAYPHQMSAGQLQRIGIARAIATEPDLVVFDEPTSALDVSVRAGILNLLRDLQRRLGMSYLFISHDLTAVRRLCHRTAVLYLGRLVEVAETEALFTDPLHPYSRALLSSVLYPDPNQRRASLVLQGEIPSPIHQPPGCPLHTRCPLVTERCSRIVPKLETKRAGRRLACLNVPSETVGAANRVPEHERSGE
jgi:oligopeptide/dipeptide ABC transporter ATP-binding protein